MGRCSGVNVRLDRFGHDRILTALWPTWIQNPNGNEKVNLCALLSDACIK